MDFNVFKGGVLTAFGFVGGLISSAFGGWREALTTLVIFMCVDYITGLLVAGVFHKSSKTETGKLESNAGWKGLVKKGVILFIILIACRLDLMIGSKFIQDATIIAFIVNEAISIAENVSLMGVPFPKVISNAIEALNKKDQNGD